MLRKRILLLILSLLLVPAMAFGQQCVVDIVVLNVDRSVRGPIKAECSPPHSVPFGNWGAEFPYFGSRRLRDGYQFSGWKVDDGWLQWNSCTNEFQDPIYYNDGDNQVAEPNVVNIVDARRDHMHVGSAGVSCEEMWNRSLEFGSTEPIELRIYELDHRILFIDGPDHVATLAYERILVQYACNDSGWDCRGESSWVRPVAGDASVYARLKLKVHLYKEE